MGGHWGTRVRGTQLDDCSCFLTTTTSLTEESECLLRRGESRTREYSHSPLPIYLIHELIAKLRGLFKTLRVFLQHEEKVREYIIGHLSVVRQRATEHSQIPGHVDDALIRSRFATVQIRITCLRSTLVALRPFGLKRRVSGWFYALGEVFVF